MPIVSRQSPSSFPSQFPSVLAVFFFHRYSIFSTPQLPEGCVLNHLSQSQAFFVSGSTHSKTWEILKAWVGGYQLSLLIQAFSFSMGVFFIYFFIKWACGAQSRPIMRMEDVWDGEQQICIPQIYLARSNTTPARKKKSAWESLFSAYFPHTFIWWKNFFFCFNVTAHAVFSMYQSMLKQHIFRTCSLQQTSGLKDFYFVLFCSIKVKCWVFFIDWAFWRKHIELFLVFALGKQSWQ